MQDNARCQRLDMVCLSCFEQISPSKGQMLLPLSWQSQYIIAISIRQITVLTAALAVLHLTSSTKTRRLTLHHNATHKICLLRLISWLSSTYQERLLIVCYPHKIFHSRLSWSIRMYHLHNTTYALQHNVS